MQSIYTNLKEALLYKRDPNAPVHVADLVTNNGNIAYDSIPVHFKWSGAL